MKKIANIWKVNTDGGCRDNPGPGAWAFVINKGNSTEEGSGFLPHCTNNQAEYRALEAALVTLTRKSQEEFSADSIEIFSDSQLIVEQINGRWKVNDLLAGYFKTAHAAFVRLQVRCPVTLSWVRREFNTAPDALCNAVMDKRGIVCSKKGRER